MKLKMSSKLHNNKKSKKCSDKEVLKFMGFTLERAIGEGTYSKVCLVISSNPQTPEKVACKIIQKKYAGAEFIKKFLPRELRIVHHLNHYNIVKVYNVFEAQDTIYMIMDYCCHGDLLEFIRNNGPLEEELAKTFFRQMVDAVLYLHGMDVAHRDLKCENVLIHGKCTLKIADFGFTRSCVDERGDGVLSETFCGSAAYAAPEIIQGIPYDPKMYDVWALGCILYIMISATMPFDDTNVKKMLKNQLNRSLCVSAFNTWKDHCVHLRNLIIYLLEPDVEKRATIRQVSNCMWLQQDSWKDLQEYPEEETDSGCSSQDYNSLSMRAFLESQLSDSSII